jgi:hypothetical protein
MNSMGSSAFSPIPVSNPFLEFYWLPVEHWESLLAAAAAGERAVPAGRSKEEQ